MTGPGDRFAPNECARAFMRTAQYMASTLPGAKVLEEARQIIHTAFAADVVAFMPHGGAGDLTILGEAAADVEATILGMVDQVRDSGFMTLETTSVPRPAVWIALPVTVRGREEAVLLVGYDGEDDLPRYLLEAMLGVAALVSSTLERQLTELELRESATNSRLILDAVGDGICRVDAAGIITFANKAALDILGCTEAELIGVSSVEFVAEGGSFAAASGIGEGRREVTLRHRDGTIFPAELVCVPIVSNGRTAGLVATFADISERKAQEALRTLAYHDTLTELPNRRLLTDRLGLAIANADRRGLRLAVMFIDLDLFKRINDTLGHDVGDLVLVEVANRLRQCIRKGDSVARLGGDEFIILLPELESPADTARLAERVITLVGQPMDLAGQGLTITASVGIALYPEDGREPETLLKCADAAMYRAKQIGRNRHLLHSDTTVS